MNCLLKTLFILAFGFFAIEGKAQKRAFQLNYSHGKILDIYPNFPDRNGHHILGLSYQWQRKSSYTASYGMAQHGANLTLHDFGNTSIFGYGIGLQYELQLHQSITQKLSLIERIGFGGILNTKPFHYLNNPENIVMGSPLAALVSVGFGFEYELSKRVTLTSEGVFWHSSNMHTALPNVGMNTPSLRVGVAYQTSAITSETEAWDKLKLHHQFEFQGRFALGFNAAGGTTRPANGPTYWKQLASAGVSYRFKGIHRISLDLETYYDGANRVWNEALEREVANPFAESSAVVLMLGHEFIYGHFGFVVNAGFNVHNPTYSYLLENGFDNVSRVNIKKYVPGRFAMRYYFTLPEQTKTSSFLQFGVKSNFTQADFLEFGLGILISKPTHQAE